MIHVGRHQTDEGGTVIRPNDAWFQLARDNTETALDERGAHEVDRDVYAHREVTKALEKLFHAKCAYCERKIEDINVEHFRPAGRVAERQDHPGYYWLTYEWRNLYLSCPPCNQRRKDKPRWEDPVEFPAAGKYDQFPVSDERTRAMRPEDDLCREQKLLIDPCIDDPEEYFGYDPFGSLISLRDPHGCKTIEVLNLNRRRLKAFRREVISVVVALGPVTPGDSSSSRREAIIATVLEKLTRSDSAHAGVARYVASRPHEFGI